MSIVLYYTIILHYTNPSILCQSSYTRMLITSYTTVTINQCLSGIFCSYSTSYFTIFVIIFIFQTQRHTLFLSVIVFLRHFYLNHNKMNAKKSLQNLQHAKKNWYLQFGSLSFGDNSIPLYKVFTSLKLLHTLYLPWRIGLLDTHHVSYKHSSNALLIISLP